MNTKHDFCPGCGAQVYPEETQCPFCGRSLRSSILTPVVAGVAGTAVALVAGALVWWVLSSPAPRPAAPAAEAPPAQTPPVVAVAPAPAVAPPAPPPPVAPAMQNGAAAPADAPRPTQPDTAAAPMGETAPSAFAPPPERAGGETSPTVAVAPPAAPAAAPEEIPEGDPESRRAFARSKQDSFAQNGLDLQVSTSGPKDTVLVIKFNFAAKTAAELIVAGPFPKQCLQRGFREILFQDPSGATWVYDIATQKMTQK
ncbi:zinc ribbon domain-containing protein [Xanthobacter sp. V2C-8]|uniref:zinc ribbon domain-containing protein n=1 Tax=Xanthobacter albus TaxID=3119929 RepID=UPI003727437A